MDYAIVAAGARQALGGAAKTRGVIQAVTSNAVLTTVADGPNRKTKPSRKRASVALTVLVIRVAGLDRPPIHAFTEIGTGVIAIWVVVRGGWIRTSGAVDHCGDVCISHHLARELVVRQRKKIVGGYVADFHGSGVEQHGVANPD